MERTRERRAAALLNRITYLRVALVPAVMGLVLAAPDVPHAYGLAAALFGLAAATDFLDGFLARRWAATTTLGSFLDTTADKLLVSGALIALVAVGRASPWVAILIVGRELVILGLRGAVAADGTVYVSWIDSRERDRARAAGAAHPGTLPPPDVRVARSADGGRTFGPGVIVARGVCPCCRTALAVVGRTVYVAWRHVFPGEVRDIVVARSDDAGESFSAPVRVHADGWAIAGCPHAGPALAADPAGGLHVAWYTGRPDAAGLYAAWSADGGRSFGPPAPLVTGEWVAISRVRLAPAGPGTAWAAWEDRGGEARVVRIARLERGRPASAVLAGAGTAPGLAAAGGIWAVAWGTQEGGVRVRLGGATGPSGAGSP